MMKKDNSRENSVQPITEVTEPPIKPSICRRNLKSIAAEVSKSMVDGDIPHLHPPRRVGEPIVKTVGQTLPDGGSSSKKTGKGSWTRHIRSGVEGMTSVHKSNILAFVVWTMLSAFVGISVSVLAERQLNRRGADGPDQRQIEQLSKSLMKCLDEQISIKETIVGLNLSLETLKKEAQERYTKLSQSMEFENVVVGSQTDEFEKEFVSKEWLFVILLVGLIGFAPVGVVWVKWKRVCPRQRTGGGSHVTHSVANGTMSSSGVGAIQGDKKVLDKVSKCRLERRVCVIGFHSETINTHTKKVRVLLSQTEATKHVTVVMSLVCCHEDILQIPPAKVFMVFVDFNERNVILEDPNKGLGDLRLTTVQAIDKMGADTILTYSNDGGSKSLASDELYNANLASVRHHPELRRLESSQRMFSVFEKFSLTQAEHITKVVKSAVM